MKFFIIGLILIFNNITLAQNVDVEFVSKKNFLNTRIDLIRNAHKRIWIAQYIINSDEIGNQILTELVNAKKQKPDLDIKIIMDGIGLGPSFPFSSSDLASLARQGIELKVFHPKFQLWNIKQRMHDKLFLVDDAVILGSSGLWAPSTSFIEELDILVKGPVHELVMQHFQDFWKEATDTTIKTDEGKSRFDETLISDNYMKPTNSTSYVFTNWEYLRDKPKKSNDSFKKILDLVNSAQNSITIMTPYPYFATELKDILKQKKEAGVSIEILTTYFSTEGHEQISMKGAFYTQVPFFSNNKIDFYVSRYFIHQKMVLVDNHRVFIGSNNLDVMGAFNNTENGIILNIDDESQKPFLANLTNLIRTVKSTATFYKEGYVENLDRWKCSEMSCGLWTVYYGKLKEEKFNP